MYVKVDHSEKTCEHCSTLFKPLRKDRRFCSRNCKEKERKKAYRKVVKDTDYCVSCGFVPEHVCQLDVDHIDGNNKNNSPSNLQVLCANCHRLKTYLNKDWEKKGKTL